MSELVKEFVGRRVIIYFNSGISGVTGTITKVDDGWVKVEDEKGKVDLVSIDYISRIQDYPPKNKDKKI